jgi:uncharacterized DUF497 family protein
LELHGATVRFEWTLDKAQTNVRKHGVRFESATAAFADPMAVIEQDQIVDGELRWKLTGAADNIALLVVAHAYRERDDYETIRIISARRADGRERQSYWRNAG